MAARGTYAWGSPGTWEASIPPERAIGVGVAVIHSLPSEVHWHTTAGRERVPVDRYRRATKHGGTGIEESDRLIVPAKRGNRPTGTLWRKGGDVNFNRWRER